MQRFSGHGLSIEIDAAVLYTWRNHRQESSASSEACGVLIGGFNPLQGVYQIVDITLPLSGDVRRYSSFVLQDAGHQRSVDSAFEASAGKHVYLGTWHTHPEPCPSPSDIDTRDWRACMARNPGRQLFFVIVGTESTRVFVASEVTFLPLTEIC
ncbi:MAG: Mov34/MPN/PAD-1 family protein [Plesiomonas shigelloides]